MNKRFRFNERKDNDAGRFAKALRGIVGKGLRYAKLIGGEGIHCPETWQATYDESVHFSLDAKNKRLTSPPRTAENKHKITNPEGRTRKYR